MFWKDNFLENLFEKEAYRVKLFHGTQMENLTSILQRGVLNNIYLTPHKERAARYAFGPNFEYKPIILEVVVTKPRRLKKMHWDPLDREEDYVEDFSFTQAPFEDTVEYLSDYLDSFFNDFLNIKVPFKLESILTLSREQGLHILDGYPIYKSLLYFSQNYLGDKFRQSKAKILDEIKSLFPVGEFTSEITVTQSGTFRLTPEYFNLLKQIAYQNKHIPPSAIKSIWVRANDFKDINADETETFGADLLPEEKEKLYNQTKVAFDDLYYNISYEFSSFLETMMNYKRDPNDFDNKEEMQFLQNTFSSTISNIINENSTDEYDINSQLKSFSKRWFESDILNDPNIEEYNDNLENISNITLDILSDLESSYDINEITSKNTALWKRINTNNYEELSKVLSEIFHNKNSYSRTWND